jgi:hypothetical protein
VSVDPLSGTALAAGLLAKEKPTASAETLTFGLNDLIPHSSADLAMPIPIRCQCGKNLNVPDNAAGKSFKCPGCGTLLKAPASAGAGTKAVTKPAGAATPSRRMNDLFDEEGFSSTVEAVCPMCRAEMKANAVLCTKCGYHKESGVKLEGHKTAGVDIDHGTLALQKAARDMVSDKAMQEKLIAGGGMPWWALALILFMISSALAIAVLVVNASRRVDQSAPTNPVALFLVMSGFAFYAVAQGAFIMIVVHAFKQSVAKGLLTLFVPFYALYHVAKNWKETWKYLVVAIVLGGIGGALFGAAAAQGGM